MNKPVFRAKVEDNILYVWAVGKWRPMREYRVKNKIPSKRIQEEVLESVWINCGRSFTLEEASLDFSE